MNLQSKKARIPIAALGACALVTGGGVLTAGSAFATGQTLSILGATSNAASTVTAGLNGSGLTGIGFGLRLSTLTGSPDVYVESLTAPTGGLLETKRVAANGAPGTTGTATAVTNGNNGATAVTVSTIAGSKTVTFSAIPQDGASSAANAALSGILRIGTGVGTQYALIDSHSSGATTATLAVPAAATASGLAAATIPTSFSGGNGSAYVTVPVTGAGKLPNYASGDNFYVGGTVAGTYTFRAFADVNSDGIYQSNTDDTTPTFTLTVKDPADAFSLSAPTTVVAGSQGSMAKITPSIDVSDIRGGSPAALGTALAGSLTLPLTDNGSGSAVTKTTANGSTVAAGATTLDFTTATGWSAGDVIENSSGVYVGTVASVSSSSPFTVTFTSGGTAVSVGAAATLNSAAGGLQAEGTGSTVSYSAADGLYRYLSSGTAGANPLRQALGTPHTVTGTLSFGGAVVTGGTKTVEVTSNSVSTLAVTTGDGQTKDVKAPSSTTRTVRAATSVVAYTATAKDSSGVVLANKAVAFTLGAGSGTTLADLSTSSSATGTFTAVPATGSSAGQVTVTTDSNGVATLYVKSAKTADTNAYTINGASGTATQTQITTTYAATAPAVVTANNVTALIGGSAVLSGKVVDQFGEPYTAGGVTAALTVSGGATPASGNYVVGPDGKFSATVQDVAANTAARNDTFGFSVAGATTQATGKTLSWRTSITPGAIAISSTTIAGSSTDTTIPFVSTATRVDVASSGGFSSDYEIVKGTVTDTASTPAVLPYASVVYSGSDGVYFYDADNKLSKTMTAAATSAGKLSFDGTTDGIRVLFTKSGAATITAVAGSATKAVTVPVADATESWKVVAQDAKSKPGQSITLLGKVTDAFDNPVVGRQVTLALSTPSAGSLSGSDANSTLAGFQVVTDTTGVWSTPFTSTSNQNGTVTVTATLANNTTPPNANLTTNPVASGAAAYTAAGLTIAHGEYQDTADVQVVDPATGIAVTNQLLGGGKAQISGTAEAGASVDLYARASGGTGFELVKTLTADETGMWGVGSTINKTTSYFARSGGKTSDTVTVTVYSIQTVKAKALGKGMVRFTVYGTPNVEGFVNIYIGSTRLAHAGTDSHGDATVDVQSKAGRRTFKIYFVAPGTSTKGTTLTGTVK